MSKKSHKPESQPEAPATEPEAPATPEPEAPATPEPEAPATPEPEALATTEATEPEAPAQTPEPIQTLDEVVSENIALLVKRSRFTHAEIARVLDRPANEVAGWEDPERGIPSLHDLKNLAIVLATEPQMFFLRRTLLERLA